MALPGFWLTHPPTHRPDTLTGGHRAIFVRKFSPFSIHMDLQHLAQPVTQW